MFRSKRSRKKKKVESVCSRRLSSSSSPRLSLKRLESAPSARLGQRSFALSLQLLTASRCPLPVWRRRGRNRAPEISQSDRSLKSARAEKAESRPSVDAPQAQEKKDAFSVAAFRGQVASSGPSVLAPSREFSRSLRSREGRNEKNSNGTERSDGARKEGSETIVERAFFLLLERGAFVVCSAPAVSWRPVIEHPLHRHAPSLTGLPSMSLGMM